MQKKIIHAVPKRLLRGIFDEIIFVIVALFFLLAALVSFHQGVVNRGPLGVPRPLHIITEHLIK